MEPITVAEAFEQAIKSFESGRPDKAKEFFINILAMEPEGADIIHNMGVLACQNKGFYDAIPLFKRAIQIDNSRPEFYNNLGNAYKSIGFCQDAISAYYSAIELSPDLTDIRLNLAKALAEYGNQEDASFQYRYAIALRENPVKAHHEAGIVMKQIGRLDDAVKCFEHIVRLTPECSVSHCNLGSIYYEYGNVESAISCFQYALSLQPDFAHAHHNLAVALQSQGILDLSIHSYRRAIEIDPDYFNALQNLAKVLQERRAIDESIFYYKRALTLNPDDERLHTSYSLALLLKGDFSAGWKEYEWRIGHVCGTEDTLRQQRYLGRHQWRGEDLAGKTLLVYAEQGLGDTIQFSRYILPLSGQGNNKIIFECQPYLKRIMTGCFGHIAKVIGFGEVLPDFDVYCPLMSLPFYFGTTLDTIPKSVSYLWEDKNIASGWQKRLVGSNRFRVGLVWAGNPLADVDTRRSLHFSQLSPILSLQGIEFFSLQKGEAARQCENLVDYTGELQDFADTAALIAQLDLVISVDTSVAHLAGAMGRPVWLLSRYDGCWRWLLEREDSPWYPTMRIFRQAQPHDWAEVMTRVADALKDYMRPSY